MPVIPAELAVVALLCTQPANVRCSRYEMREIVLKCTRSSSKPKRENRREINYANLNDGLDEEDIYSPPPPPPGKSQVEKGQAPFHLRRD